MINIQNIKDLMEYTELYKKVLKRAQFESEIELGVNPSNQNQTDVSALTESDVGYINKVCILVENKLNDIKWILNTIKCIEDKYKDTSKTNGIKFNDELYKPGRGILEDYLKENKNDL